MGKPAETDGLQSSSSAYVHVPFCRHRCGYCNFTLVAGRDDLVVPYLDALQRELLRLQSPQEVDTLFVGGGTPTRLSGRYLKRFLGLLQQWLPLRAGGEHTWEANPMEVTAELLARLRGGGVNRLSLGVQSLDRQVLRTLERDHSPEQALRAVRLSQSVFERTAVDLIFAAPGQTLSSWEQTLQAVIDARVEHVSTYGLTFEKGAAFWGRRRRGELQTADEELERQMYLSAIAQLQSAGWEHYEVSNFARPGGRCRHNLNYWQGGDYLAFGPGAARHCQGRREVNHRSTTRYIQQMLGDGDPVAQREQLDAEQRARERLVFGLRMLEGVDKSRFLAQTGFTVDQLAAAPIARFVELGLLANEPRRLRLTEAGLLVSDSIVPELL